ncbi:astacin-like metalloendopeptidase isoform X2 [Leucoraja erinacea]|uniref:astacin-like metalloendopeptidase isoform X2 n=1 Tax=Leucoraja erinaceus TaxID=7782 RepID=UPI0024563E63|nr:astacin-like metalloendopeptidase isoform X2 [Leucoraja erinacea]
MDLTIAVLLTLALRCIHSALMDYKNSTLKDGMKSEETEQDVFRIILKQNKELLKQTGNKKIHFGDVLVDKSRNAMVCNWEPRSCLWPASEDGNVYVPYKVSSDYNEQDKTKIQNALGEVNSLTCVKFYYKRRNERAYISVTQKVGCFAHVGYAKSERGMSLQKPGCIQHAVIIHEFLHSIGFQHEQSRTDRDKYITVFPENICPGQEYNFKLLNTNNLGTKYDYGSVMHYGKTAFAKKGTFTMLAKPNSSIELGQYLGLSTTDVYKINKLYNCVICGNMLIKMSGSFTSPNFPANYPNNADCLWIIRSKRKYKILLEFSSFAIKEFAACLGDHVTVYDGANKLAKILVRPACGAESPAALSSNNELLITFRSTWRLPARGFNANYKFVECGFMMKSRKGNFLRFATPFRVTHCFWVVLARMKRQLTLKIKDLNIQKTKKCENHLIIHGNAQSPPRKYCEQSLYPINITSSGRAIVLEFHHATSINQHGFKVSYSSVFNKHPPVVVPQASRGSYYNSFGLAPGILLTFLWKT